MYLLFRCTWNFHEIDHVRLQRKPQYFPYCIFKQHIISACLFPSFNLLRCNLQIIKCTHLVHISMLFDKSIYPSSHHSNQNTENFHHPPKLPCTSTRANLLSPHQAINLLSITIDWVCACWSFICTESYGIHSFVSGFFCSA